MKYYRFWLVIILILVAFTGWVVWPDNPGLHIDALGIDTDIEVRQGLDLQGGSRVLLEAVEGLATDISGDELNATRQIVERRVNGLGLTEAIVQTQGSNRILVELPGVSDRELALSTIQGTGLLEFVDFSGLGVNAPGEGACIMTTEQLVQISSTPTCAPAEGENERRDAQPRLDGTPYQTVMTGSGLDDAQAVPAGTGFNQWVVSFTLNNEGNDIFADFTGNHIGQPMAIVLDGIVISAPSIEARISGSGQITGNFTKGEAEALAIQLRYGALPVPLQVAAFDTVGPTLGEISVDKSIRAGTVGVITVLVFLIFYYRAPGIAAALALLVFALINFALYKLVPITLTLPAITGFLISIGTAVDGNILIFERMKEELRAGRNLETAIQLGFERAWSAIWTSNVSTIIIGFILLMFGRTFGASTVQGFAITLMLGLVLNLFTAVIVTRTFLNVIVALAGGYLRERPALLGA
ncbi:MAG: protein translocase subunit SecD [Anaerolineae bacterium]|nr:protein translocase subunit SecD [Anaerolineae bacterium]